MQKTLIQWMEMDSIRMGHANACGDADRECRIL